MLRRASICFIHRMEGHVHCVQIFCSPDYGHGSLEVVMNVYETRLAPQRQITPKRNACSSAVCKHVSSATRHFGHLGPYKQRAIGKRLCDDASVDTEWSMYCVQMRRMGGVLKIEEKARRGRRRAIGEAEARDWLVAVCIGQWAVDSRLLIGGWCVRVGK